MSYSLEFRIAKLEAELALTFRLCEKLMDNSEAQTQLINAMEANAKHLSFAVKSISDVSVATMLATVGSLPPGNARDVLKEAMEAFAARGVLYAAANFSPDEMNEARAMKARREVAGG